MKKHIAIAAGLAVLSGSAYATKARMSGLAQGSYSYFLDDTRSVFLNPAAVNSMKDYAVTEWGSSTTGTTPNAEGGFFKSAGSFNYGVYLGNDMNSQNAYRTGTTTGYTGAAGFSEAGFLARTNEIDLFFGGDMGVEWGVNLQYTSGEDKQAALTKEQSGLTLGLGMAMGDLEAYAHMTLSDESKGASTAGDKWEGNGMQVGLSYAMSGYKFYGDYGSIGFDYTNEGAAKTEASQTTMTFGVAKVTSINSSSVFVWDINYTNEKSEDKNASGTAEKTDTALPVTIGFEADATSWLTLRGGVQQRVIINNVENKPVGSASTDTTTADTTTVTAGATLNFGKLKLDGTFGGVGSGVLNANNLFANVGVHYWF